MDDDADGFDETTSHRRQRQHEVGIVPGAKFVLELVVSGSHGPHQLTYKTEADDPDVDEDEPEVVLERCRVFQPQDEDVSDDSHGVDQEEPLRNEHLLQHDEPEADVGRQRADDEAQGVEVLDGEAPDDPVPADGRDQHVDESPLAVGAELFEPDDRVANGRQDDAGDDGERDRHVLDRVVRVDQVKAAAAVAVAVVGGHFGSVLESE